MISTISTTKATDRPASLPTSTGTWEMWWCLACNAGYRGDRQAKRVALAQYRRAVELEIGSQLLFDC
jgi:hypothetical protein